MVPAVVKDGLGIIIHHGYPEMDLYPGRRSIESGTELNLSYAKVHVFGRRAVAEKHISEFEIRMHIRRSFTESNPGSLACYAVYVWHKRDGGEVQRAIYSYALWDKKVQYQGPHIGEAPYPIRF